jgi:hypothetical protein
MLLVNAIPHAPGKQAKVHRPNFMGGIPRLDGAARNHLTSGLVWSVSGRPSMLTMPLS